jgi:hypothetical protein
MTTGRYQCLKPQGETIMMRYASEFTTALRVYAAAQSFQLPSLRGLARREMIALGDMLSLPSLVDIMEESSLSLSTLPGIAAYVESRILAFAENITYTTSEKVLSEIGTPSTLSMVLLKAILLLQTSKVSLRDDSLRKEEPVEILRGLSDTGPIAKGKASDVDQVMKEAEEQAAKRAEEKAAEEVEKAAAKAVLDAEAEEEAKEEEEMAALKAKKAKKVKLTKTETARLMALVGNSVKRAQAKSAKEAEEAAAAQASREAEESAIREAEEKASREAEEAAAREAEAAIAAEEEKELAALDALKTKRGGNLIRRKEVDRYNVLTQRVTERAAKKAAAAAEAVQAEAAPEILVNQPNQYCRGAKNC